jgi:vacuolar protein sorting-associated protein 13A/C
MWSIYSVATSKNSDGEESGGKQHNPDSSIKNSMAASAARNLLTSLPYAIENHCGDNTVFTLPGGNIDRRPCPHGSIQYFRFQPPQGSGYGGKKLYGQDVEFEKSVTLFFEDSVVVIPHLDATLLSPRQSHDLPDGRVLVTYVVREGKTTVSHAIVIMFHLTIARF